MKKAFLVFVVVAALIGTSYAQVSPKKESLGKEINGRELEWADFTGEVDATSPWDAYTSWTTTYRYPAPIVYDGRVYIAVKVSLFLKPNSWVRPHKKSDILLEHERGHFNIARICAKQIEETINSATFSTSNYRKEIDDAYWMVIGRCKELEKRYDDETKHYNDRTQQALWNRMIHDLLKK